MGFVKNPLTVSAVADSGIFLNVKTQGGAMKLESTVVNLYKLSNANENGPLTICNSFYYGS